MTPLPAHAWGDEGHRIVALIAESYLVPSVRERVQSLLASDATALVADRSIASEATWADRYRDADRHAGGAHYQQTYRWHFVDLDLHRPNLERACFGRPRLPAGVPASEGPAEDCIVDKIDQFEAELASGATARDERRIALQFLLHLVGDLHQPLHACTDHDEGGNLRRVAIAGDASVSLHAYWDTQLVQRLGADPRAVAAALMAHISRADVAAWSRGNPADWALESYQVARSVAYGRLFAGGGRERLSEQYRLSDEYVEAATRAVRAQLSRAGVRLGLLLNRALQ